MPVTASPYHLILWYVRLFYHLRNEEASFEGNEMSVFRFERDSAPTADQRERYMIGEVNEKYFGPAGQIVLIEYPEAIYLRDDLEHIRILYTGSKDKKKAYAEVTRLISRHEYGCHTSTGNA